MPAPKATWLRYVRKDELCELCREFGLDVGGTVDDLRTRLKEFIQAGAYDTTVADRLEELEAVYRRAASPSRLAAGDESLDRLSPKHRSTEALSFPNPTAATTTVTTTTPAINLPIPGTREDLGSASSFGSYQFSLPKSQPAASTTTTTTVWAGPTVYSTSRHGPPAALNLRANGENPQPGAYEAAVERVRKWTTRFDGRNNVLEFIERLEEQATTFAVECNLLPRMMPELLQGKALLWYRNNNRGWTTWAEFKRDLQEYFLPARYFEQLEDAIRDRRQRPGERFKDFVIVLQDMMRHAGFDEDTQLSRIFRNSRTEYQRYIQRRDFTCLRELVQLAEDLEILRQMEEHDDRLRAITTEHRPGIARPPMRSPVAQRPGDARSLAPVPNPTTACRACGQQGHISRECTNQRVLFCWQCGRRNIRTINCCQANQGNGRGENPMREGSTPVENPARR